MLSLLETQREISIHAPRKGERHYVTCRDKKQEEFQSTLPARGSDSAERFLIHALHGYFNPRSPQGGATGRREVPVRGDCDFNPRSPQGGATVFRPCLISHLDHFNPRSPQGGATIPAPTSSILLKDFNPRSPQGGATL